MWFNQPTNQPLPRQGDGGRKNQMESSVLLLLFIFIFIYDILVEKKRKEVVCISSTLGQKSTRVENKQWSS